MYYHLQTYSITRVNLMQFLADLAACNTVTYLLYNNIRSSWKKPAREVIELINQTHAEKTEKIEQLVVDLRLLHFCIELEEYPTLSRTKLKQKTPE